MFHKHMWFSIVFVYFYQRVYTQSSPAVLRHTTENKHIVLYRNVPTVSTAHDANEQLLPNESWCSPGEIGMEQALNNVFLKGTPTMFSKWFVVGYEQSLPHNINPPGNHGGCKDLHIFGTIRWGVFYYINIGITIIYLQLAKWYSHSNPENHNFNYLFNGNLRTLKWRYCTMKRHCGYISLYT